MTVISKFMPAIYYEIGTVIDPIVFEMQRSPACTHVGKTSLWATEEAEELGIVILNDTTDDDGEVSTVEISIFNDDESLDGTIIPETLFYTIDGTTFTV